jgi:hypothetical protein
MTASDSPTIIDALGIRRRLGAQRWSLPMRFGDGWRYDSVPAGARVIVTCADYGDGVDWVHASVSRVDVMPSYDDLTMLHAAVFVDGWAYQVFAPPAEHVNIHARALHLFGRLDGRPALPDFTLGTGSI